jgi:hypothetical protein
VEGSRAGMVSALECLDAPPQEGGEIDGEGGDAGGAEDEGGDVHDVRFLFVVIRGSGESMSGTLKRRGFQDEAEQVMRIAAGEGVRAGGAGVAPLNEENDKGEDKGVGGESSFELWDAPGSSEEDDEEETMIDDEVVTLPPSWAAMRGDWEAAPRRAGELTTVTSTAARNSAVSTVPATPPRPPPTPTRTVER